MARLGIALGIALAVLSMVLVRSAILDAHQAALHVPTMTEVVIAQAVPADGSLTAADLTTRQIAQADAPPGLISQPSEAVGRITQEAMVPGEPVLSTFLYSSAEQAGLTAELPKAMRAVELPVGAQSGVGTALQPGDRVDVLAVLPSRTGPGPQVSILLSDIEILGLVNGSNTSTLPGQDTSGYGGVILELSDRQAAALLLATDTGSVQLSLRGAEDRAGAAPVTVTTTQLLGEVRP